MRQDARTKPLTDDELAWFARDRRGDAKEAVEKVVQYLRWRKDRGGLGSDRESLMRRAAPEARRRVGYLAREKDALNRPTVVVVARRHDAMRRDLKASQALCVAVLEDAIAEAVKDALKRPANRRCADCEARGPTVACLMYRTFICQNCAAAHRELFPSGKLKSISLAEFATDEVCEPEAVDTSDSVLSLIHI